MYAYDNMMQCNVVQINILDCERHVVKQYCVKRNVRKNHRSRDDQGQSSIKVVKKIVFAVGVHSLAAMIIRG